MFRSRARLRTERRWLAKADQSWHLRSPASRNSWQATRQLRLKPKPSLVAVSSKNSRRPAVSPSRAIPDVLTNCKRNGTANRLCLSDFVGCTVFCGWLLPLVQHGHGFQQHIPDNLQAPRAQLVHGVRRCVPIGVRVAIIEVDEVRDGNACFGERYVIIAHRLAATKEVRLKTQRGSGLIYKIQ